MILERESTPFIVTLHLMTLVLFYARRYDSGLWFEVVRAWMGSRQLELGDSACMIHFSFRDPSLT